MNKGILSIIILLSFCLNYASAQQCNVIYVSPGGATSGIAGTKTNPASLEYGLTLVSPGNNIMYLRSGTYNISQTINLVSNVRIYGGYNSLWEKTNGAESIIIRDFSNPTPNPLRLVALQGNNINNFELHDVTVKTANAVGPAVSTYAIYLNSCSNYELIRVKAIAGAASNGNPGNSGTNGLPGANGSAGEAGDEDGPCCTAGGAPGSGSFAGSNPGGAGGDGGARGTYSFPVGGSAPPGAQGSAAPGVGAGAPGLGGVGVDDRIISLVSCPRTTLNDGTDGTDGANGVNGTLGSDGVASFSGGFFQPAVGQNGTAGTNGLGGGGGGGGGSQGYVVVIPAFPPLIPNEINNNGAGAGGGGGGEGGQAGTGGIGGNGGGSSFAVFLWNNGPGATVRDCFFNAGTFGLGGNGGNGGIGGNGGSGGPGGGPLNCDIGAGGNGGSGGKGGNGGKGGRGSDGVSIDLYQDPAGNPANLLNINNLQQPVVKVNASGCTNSPITFSTTQTGTITWYFGAGSNPPSASGQTAVCSYTTTGAKTFTMVWNGIPYTYTKFIEIYNATTPSVPQILSSDSVLCEGVQGTYTSSVTANNYEWRVTGGPNAINDFFSGASFNTFNYTFVDAGEYTVYLQTVDNCCGKSFMDSFYVHVDSVFAPGITIQSSVATNNNTVCQGSNVIFTAAPVNAGNTPTFQWSVDGNPAGSNSPTFVLNNPTSGNTVSCTVTSSLGCSTGQIGNSNQISITVIGTPVITCSADSFYSNNPTFFNASVSSGGLAPFSYAWDFGNNAFGSGDSVATVYPNAGTYNVQVDVTDANGCTGSCNLVVLIENFLTADFKADVFNGCAPLTVNYTNLSVNGLTYLWDLGDGQTSNQVNPTHVYNTPGTYNVTLYAFSASGTLTQSVNNQIQVFPVPVANFLAYPEVIGVAGDIVNFADNSINAWTWQWNFGDPSSGANNTSNIQNPSHFYATNGNYSVTLIVTNNYGCSDTLTKNAFIKVAVGVENQENQQYLVFPNPFNNQITIRPSDKSIINEVTLLDINGKEIYKQNAASLKNLNGDLIIPVAEYLTKGIYLLKVSDGKNSSTFKLLKD